MIINLLKKMACKLLGYQVIRNAGKSDDDGCKPRALLVYITEPFTMKEDDPRFLTHQNMRQSWNIVQVLGELGYIVDVAHANDLKFSPKVQYHIVIRQKVGHFPAMESPFLLKAIKVYLATGMNPLVHNQNLKRRHEAYASRRGRTLPLVRTSSEEMMYVAVADAIFAFGNKNTGETWRQSFDCPLYMFNNYAYSLHTNPNIGKNYCEARKNFLYFASSTQILKGLDLLLEIFPQHPELHLYVCGGYEKERDFCSSYSNELQYTPNIHPSGWIHINSPEYHQITSICAYTILPSCSEGSAGSIVQTMSAGLSPVVTKECGIDTDNFGVTFQNDSLEEIEHVILGLASMPPKEVQRRCEKSRTVAELCYSEEVFLARWREMIQQVMSVKQHS